MKNVVYKAHRARHQMLKELAGGEVGERSVGCCTLIAQCTSMARCVNCAVEQVNIAKYSKAELLGKVECGLRVKVNKVLVRKTRYKVPPNRIAK